MNVSVNVRGIPEAKRYLAGNERKIAVATTRAIRDTLKYTRTRIKREAAKALKVPQKVLTSRLFISKIKNGESKGKLWAGTWNISPLVLGPVASGRKSRVIQVGRYRYPGAFYERVYGSRPDIWIRLSSKHFDKALYPGGRKKAGTNTLDPELRGRFPVAKAAISIEEAMGKTFDRNEDEIRQEFYKKLRKEINYAINIEGRK